MMNAIRYGLLFSLAIFLWLVAESSLGLHGQYIRYHEYLSYFFAVPAVIIMYKGIRSGESSAQRSIPFGKGLLKGLGITAIVAVLCPLVRYVFCVYVNPTFLGNMAKYAVEVKAMSPTLAASRFELTGYLVMSVFSTVVIGVVISLVMAVILAARQR